MNQSRRLTVQEVNALRIPFPQTTYRETEQLPVADSIISNIRASRTPCHTTQYPVLADSFPEPNQLKQDLYQLGQQYTDMHLKYLEHAIRKTDEHLIQVGSHNESTLRLTELYLSIYQKTLKSLLTLTQQQKSTTQRFIDVPELFRIAMDFATLPADDLESMLCPLKALIDETESEAEYISELFNYDEEKYYQAIKNLYHFGTHLLTQAEEVTSLSLAVISRLTTDLYECESQEAAATVIGDIYRVLGSQPVTTTAAVATTLGNKALFLTPSILSSASIYYCNAYTDQEPTEPISHPDIESLFGALTDIDPHLIQFEELALSTPNELLISSSAVLFYPNQVPIKHPRDISGIGKEVPSVSCPLYQHMQQLTKHKMGTKVYSGDEINEMLNITWQLGGSDQARDVDIKRMLGISDSEEHRAAFKQVFPPEASPQSVLSMSTRQFNLHGSPNADHSFSFDANKNEILLMECAFIIQRIPEFHFQPKISVSSTYHTTFDGNYCVVPSSESLAPYHIYLLEDRISRALFSPEEEALLRQNSFIIQQPNDRFIATTERLQQTVERQVGGEMVESVEYRTRIQDAMNWCYAMTSNNTVIFLDLGTIDQVAFREQHDACHYSVRVKHSRKRSLWSCLNNDTGGIHDKPLTFIDELFLQAQGKWLAESLGLTNQYLTPSILTSTLSLVTHKDKPTRIEHQSTTLSSHNPGLITYSNGLFVQPIPLPKSHPSLKNRVTQFIDGYHNPSKSLKGLFFAIIITLLAIASILFFDNIIWAGIICVALVVSTAILYQCNWLHYMHSCVRSQPSAKMDNSQPPAPRAAAEIAPVANEQHPPPIQMSGLIVEDGAFVATNV